MYVCMGVCVRVYTWICMYIYIYVTYVDTYICIYTCRYIYIRRNIRTCPVWLNTQQSMFMCTNWKDLQADRSTRKLTLRFFLVLWAACYYVRLGSSSFFIHQTVREIYTHSNIHIYTRYVNIHIYTHISIYIYILKSTICIYTENTIHNMYVHWTVYIDTPWVQHTICIILNPLVRVYVVHVIYHIW